MRPLRTFLLAATVLMSWQQFTAQSLPPVLGAVTDAASFGGEIAPGMIVSAFGTSLGERLVEASAPPAPFSLDGVGVEIEDAGVYRQAPLYFVSPNQVNFQMPFDLRGAQVGVRVRTTAGVTAPVPVSISACAPRVFTATMKGKGAALALHADYSRVSGEHPALPGETLVLYVIGLGDVIPPAPAGAPAGDGGSLGPLNLAAAPVDVLVANLPAKVHFAGLAPGYSGLYQINFSVPEVTAPGEADLRVIAAQKRSQDHVTVPVAALPAREFFAAPDGSARGDGSRELPWDLQTALNHPAELRPGDTLWLRGGVFGAGAAFHSHLHGAPGRPILVRQFPGERATIDGSLSILGPYSWYWGFEITRSTADRASDSGSECVSTLENSKGIKLINLTLHDCAQGIGFWRFAEDAEAYGNIIYYNGYQGPEPDRGHGHGIYTQNQTGIKRIEDNIIFDQFGLGIQAYGSESAFVQGYEIEGNILFNNGSIARDTANVDNILLAVGRPIENVTIENNYTYHPGTNGYSRMGWVFGQNVANRDVIVRNNYWIGGQPAIEFWNWDEVIFSGNTSYSQGSPMALLSLNAPQNERRYTWDHNIYYGSGVFRFSGRNLSWDRWRTETGLDAASTWTRGRPAGSWVFVRPNKYEKGRAHVVVYNWDLQPTVSVDLSAALRPGDSYEIRDAQHFFGPPVAAGAYEGRPVPIPMTGLQSGDPVGRVPSPPRHTAPEFGAFVVVSH